jgi:hypothetical protein
MTDTKAKGFTRSEIMRCLENEISDDVFIIARMIEIKYKRKPGSCHLAVKKVMRVLEREGIIGVRGPKDQWDTYKLYLMSKYK